MYVHVLQEEAALALVQAGAREGRWVFLANCHLAPACLPALEHLAEGMAAAPPHPGFRLWLSASHTAAFPAALLQRCAKIANQQPQVIRKAPMHS